MLIGDGMKQILLVDYGSYYFKDVVKCMELLDIPFFSIKWDDDLNQVDKGTILGIILTGSPGRINNPEDPQLNMKLLEFDVPVLGICYGMQALMHSLGGKVEALSKRDLGKREMHIIKRNPINEHIDNGATVQMAHYDHVTQLADGFEILARTDISIAMIADENRKIYAVQYHPEALKEKDDMQLFKNFVQICLSVR